MKDEFEVISHGAADYKVFVVNLLYRTPHIHKDFEICLILEGSVRNFSSLPQLPGQLCWRRPFLT